MAQSLASLRYAVQYRLGDAQTAVWSVAEIEGYLRTGYQELATALRVFWDWTYLENLPTGFSCTGAWERLYDYVEFDYGLRNYTLDDERRELTEGIRIGPANHTSPADLVWLADCVASEAISATADLPDTVTEIDRAVWDRRTMDALSPRDLQALDTRYQVTAGEVYGFTFRQDGLRTFRKVRRPSTKAAAHTVTGSWGVMRSVSDFAEGDATTEETVPRAFSHTSRFEAVYAAFHDSGRATHTFSDEEWHAEDAGETFLAGPANFTAVSDYDNGYVADVTTPTTNTAVWGTVRRIPGEHPMGPEAFGSARRPYKDGTNVRVEHWRHGRPITAGTDVCELPDRYALALRDYAQMRCLSRPGPGQDRVLAGYYQQRWTRVLARIKRRLDSMDTQRVGVMGGGQPQIGSGPPRPRLPWQYGQVLR